MEEMRCGDVKDGNIYSGFSLHHRGYQSVNPVCNQTLKIANRGARILRKANFASSPEQVSHLLRRVEPCSNPFKEDC
jgi:hypothetical protein